MPKTETPIIGLDQIKVNGTEMSKCPENSNLEIDYNGNLFRWEIAPGQEGLSPDETQEIIVIPVKNNNG